MHSPRKYYFEKKYLFPSRLLELFAKGMTQMVFLCLGLDLNYDNFLPRATDYLSRKLLKILLYLHHHC